MKRKLFSTLVALVLLLTLGLVAAVPAGATPAPAAVSFDTSGGDVTAEWSTAKAGETGAMGAYSVELHAGFDGSDWAEIVLTPPAGITLDDMATITTGWSWWYFIKTADFGARGTQMELHFESATDPDGYAEMTIMYKAYGSQPAGPPTLDAWTEQTIVSDTTTGLIFGTEEDGTTIDEYPAGHEGTIADLVTHVEGLDANAGNWVLTEVRPALGWIGASETTAYIDDVTIDGVTYSMEPMVLTAEYYKTGASVGAAVFNSNKSGTIAIFATSTTLGEDGKITVALTETDTGVFTGGFQLVDGSPGPGQLLVNEGDTITVKCASDWGAGDQTLGFTDPPSATVDDTLPVINITAPAASANTSDNTTDIAVTLTDVNSSIKASTILMKVDTTTIPSTSYTYNSGTGALTYTTAELTDGPHTVTVDVSDVAGNAATQKSRSFTVDIVDPVITGQVADPTVIPPDEETEVTFSANVTDATSGVDTVKINLTNVGGGAAVAMLDADADGIYTASANITKSAQADYELTVTATDVAGNEGTADITLGVWSDIVDPVITDPAITYEYGSSARPGDDVTISANVTDNIGVDSVTVACTALEGTPVSLTQGVGDTWSVTTTIASDAAWDDYTVTISAADAVGNEDTNVSLTLAVRSGATGQPIDLVEGWNLISLPLIPDDSDITAVISATTLTSANVSSIGIIRAYDPATGEFPYYIPETGSGELATMEDGAGYWVFMDADDTLTITGREWPAPPAVPPVYSVVVGWNLIGFKSMTSANATYYLDNIAGTYPVLWSYNATAGAYSNVKGVENGMEVGHGFWIWVTTAGTIVPPE